MFKFYAFFSLINTLICFHSSTGLDYIYHNYENLTTILKDYAARFPQKAHLYSIGKTVEGRDIWVIAIAGRQPDAHLLLRPEVKLIGNIHGNELPSGELLLHFVNHLLTNPTSDPSVEYVLRNIRVHALLSLNADGANHAAEWPALTCENDQGRTNSLHFDLNKNFPDKFYCNRKMMQPETKAVISWMETNTFVLSGKFQSGFLAVSYPWENFKKERNLHARHGESPVDVPTDFDDMFRYLASRYSFNHKTMLTETCKGEKFTDGITNGAYGFARVKGGMQDFNFWRYGCAELTIGVSCCTTPAETQLAELWEANTKSLIEFTKRANTGVRGVIEFKNRGPAANVGVKFDSRDPVFKTNNLGEFYALIVPGNYTISIVISCDIVLFSSQVEVPVKSRLLVLNITLTEKDYEKASSYHFDKYPLFCVKANAPVDCSQDSHDDTTTDDDSEDEHSENSARRSFTNFELIFVTCIALLIYRSIRD